MTSEAKRDNAEIEYLATPFKLSRIALGTWAIGGWMWGGTDETAAIGVIHEAVDRGVTLIDTAPAYGSAARRRSWARRWPRTDFVIASS
jgi:aryl-alcohol dehydrogenase-like predicted oxidoreductase